MMLLELTTVDVASLPVARFKDHLRLGSGFADDGLQDDLLEGYLRAAMAAVEARTGKILIERDFSWTVDAWQARDTQALPIAPVSAIVEVNIVDRHGVVAGYSSELWRLVPDTHAPRLASSGYSLPVIPTLGHAQIVMLAGFGPEWDDLPADLAQAVMLLAAYYYEYRHESSSNIRQTPFGVQALIERHRIVRLFMGRGQR